VTEEAPVTDDQLLDPITLTGAELRLMLVGLYAAQDALGEDVGEARARCRLAEGVIADRADVAARAASLLRGDAEVGAATARDRHEGAVPVRFRARHVAQAVRGLGRVGADVRAGRTGTDASPDAVDRLRARLERLLELPGLRASIADREHDLLR
jgi:hypothetical protein